jgi:hypothetical protein
MKNTARHGFTALLLVLAGSISIGSANAQNPELQQRVAEITQSIAANKQALAQYTWVEQMTISLKGEQKKQEHFQVHLGPDGQPQKTSLDPPPEAPSGRQGRLKEHVIAKKKEEYEDYADQMKALAQQYVPPSKELLEQAYQQGNIALSPAGVPGTVKLVIHNYLKPNDSLTLVFDKAQKALLQVQVTSYMSDPKDAMTLTVQFSSVPNGPNHVSNTVMDGVSKQLNIAVQNSNYQRL